MCGFYFSTRKHLSSRSLTKLKARGPDNVSDVTVNGCRFVHTHLSIFSSAHDQPFLDHEHELVLMFNGEIYNCPENQSEAQFIIAQYLSSGIGGFKNLDGEFAILLVDFSQDQILLATDPFGTKPLFYSFSNGIHVSSYPGPLVSEGINPQLIQSANPNFACCYSIGTKQLLHARELVSWDLEQFETSFETWSNAFEASVLKRVRHKRPSHIPFVGISSGYDSGAIHSCLLKLNDRFLGISISGKEDIDIIKDRHSLSVDRGCQHITVNDLMAKQVAAGEANIMNELIEDLPYKVVSDARQIIGEPESVLKDKASVGLAILASIARKNSSQICLSGSGADEIISDYGFRGKPIYQHSNFGGNWPKNLESIFPWASFYGSTQQAYIRKEEAVGGAYGIETRYPFLDKAVVQAWLNISPELKNQDYKSCINNYLRNNGYPFKVEKKGFSPWAA